MLYLGWELFGINFLFLVFCGGGGVGLSKSFIILYQFLIMKYNDSQVIQGGFNFINMKEKIKEITNKFNTHMKNKINEYRKKFDSGFDKIKKQIPGLNKKYSIVDNNFFLNGEYSIDNVKSLSLNDTIVLPNETQLFFEYVSNIINAVNNPDNNPENNVTENNMTENNPENNSVNNPEKNYVISIKNENQIDIIKKNGVIIYEINNINNINYDEIKKLFKFLKSDIIELEKNILNEINEILKKYKISLQSLLKMIILDIMKPTGNGIIKLSKSGLIILGYLLLLLLRLIGGMLEVIPNIIFMSMVVGGGDKNQKTKNRKTHKKKTQKRKR